MKPPYIDQTDFSRGAAANDVNVLISTRDRQRSEAEFPFALRRGRLYIDEDHSTPARLSSIEGVPINFIIEKEHRDEC